MSMNEQMNHAEENILHTYNRFPVMFDHGEGCIFMIQRAKNISTLLPELQ